MKILILDTASNALDWAMRCQDAGHEIMWYDKPRKDGSRRRAGEGIVPKLTDFDLLRKRYIGWADLIFMPDNTAYTDLLEPYRKMGYPIFAPSPEAADLELNRRLGQEAMKKAGLKTIPGVAFDDYDKAAAFVEKHPTYLVSKPSGDADKALSYVADDAASLIHMLTQRWKKNDKYRSDARKHGFILQEKIKGAEFAVGGWFGPGGWSKWWYENLENKKLMNGDLGPNTGEMGTVSMYVRNSKLADIGLKPMTDQLHKLDYCGFVDIAGMVDEKGQFWPFEFTMRPGWPTFHNQVATHDGDPAQWMLDLLLGNDTLKVKENVCCISVVMAIPDFPYSHLTNKEVSNIPVYNADDREHIHLSEVMLGDDVPTQIGDKVVRLPGYVTCGDYVAVVTGTGDTITGARRSAYSAIKKIKMPASPFYRTDIGACRTARDLEALQKHGFARNFKIL
jgi:phosphoribosylamine--glycine ligase